MHALDTLNDHYGRGALKMASAGIGAKKAWGMKQERRTLEYMTRWDDIRWPKPDACVARLRGCVSQIKLRRMTDHALQILSDDPGSFRWVILKPTVNALVFEEHSVADCDFAEYADALNAGTLALARADGESYENEAADPVGDADCGG